MAKCKPHLVYCISYIVFCILGFAAVYRSPRIRRFFATLALLAFFIVFADPLIAKETISVQGEPYQGGMLFLKVNDVSPDCLGICYWDNQVFPMARNGDALEVILPVSVEISPGSHKISATLHSMESESMVLTEIVEIKQVRFNVQHLWMSRAQFDKYFHPSLDEEYRLIDKALVSYSDEKYWNGDFIWPCKGPVTTEFGLKRFVNGEPFGWHRGIDIACLWGTPVKASNDGKVILANNDFVLHGRTVIIDHGQGITTIYIHMSKIFIKEDDLVKKGQVIGNVGTTGVSTGPHLHWAAYAFGTPINPECLLKMAY